jgi:hypothetical protein
LRRAATRASMRDRSWAASTRARASSSSVTARTVVGSLPEGAVASPS